MKSKNGFSDLDIGGDWEDLAANCAAKTRFYCRNRGENRSLARSEVENFSRRAALFQQTTIIAAVGDFRVL